MCFKLFSYGAKSLPRPRIVKPPRIILESIYLFEFSGFISEKQSLYLSQARPKHLYCKDITNGSRRRSYKIIK